MAYAHMLLSYTHSAYSANMLEVYSLYLTMYKVLYS